jgi:hypothetical protein
MARAINANALAKLATQYGTEPINIIEIQWTKSGPRDAYADRDIEGGVKGRILEISGLDAIIQVSGGSDSQEISIKLDDTDGSLKAILDSVDVHKRPVWVYQWFEGLDLADKFLIFKGQINSPVEWDEGDRTLSFTVISKIEDIEVGFSIEEGDIIDPPKDLIGKPWPLCFGKVINVPALKINSIRQGILATGNGIRDFTLSARIKAAEAIICPLDFKGFEYLPLQGDYRSLIIKPIYDINQDCAKRKCEVIESLKLQYNEQGQFQFPTMTVFGGEKFPQAPKEITINVNGGKFKGKMHGNVFHVNSDGYIHPRNDGTGKLKLDPTAPAKVIQSKCGDVWKSIYENFQKEILKRFPQAFDCLDPQEAANQGLQSTCAQASKYTWDVYQSIPEAGFFWANAGDLVTLDGDNEIIYVANILPSTVLRVAAWRELNGGRQLVTVPANYYTVRHSDFNSYTVCEIVFDKPLSSRNEGWEDDIYVSLESTVGPNTVDILRWFIEFYTDYSIDETSFNAVRALVDNYPMHFWLRERKNILDVLKEIAYQARCAIWLRDDTFYIKYLSTEPDADDTITESDIIANSLKLTHTPTEDLITKYVAEWYKDYAIEKPNKVILSHNVSKYGTHEQVFDYYCFNIHELVVKTATFWLIRSANTWRKAVFSTPIHKLKLEVFDTVALTLPDIADGTVKAIIEKANYNSETRQIDFEVWTPLKSGSRAPYDFAFPADVREEDIWPTLEERELGLAGSGRGPNFSVIAPNAHPLSNDRPGLTQGFQLEGCKTATGQPCRENFGDQRPSDAGDQKPSPDVTQDQNGDINIGTSPISTSPSVSDSGIACCEEAKRAAEQARQEAQQARIEASEAAKAAGRDKQKEQPGDKDPEGAPKQCGGPCTSTVKAHTIIPRLLYGPPGQDPFFRQGPGATGRVAIADWPHEKCWTFKSKSAAAAFMQALIDRKKMLDATYGWEWGVEYEYTFDGLENPTPAPGDPPCPPDDSGAIIGFTKTPL